MFSHFRNLCSLTLLVIFLEQLHKQSDRFLNTDRHVQRRFLNSAIKLSFIVSHVNCAIIMLYWSMGSLLFLLRTGTGKEQSRATKLQASRTINTSNCGYQCDSHYAHVVERSVRLGISQKRRISVPNMFTRQSNGKYHRTAFSSGIKYILRNLEPKIK